MNTWSPLFSKVVDSSIWHEPYFVRVLFMTMLALKDADHVVRCNAFMLASRAHMTEKEVLDGLKVLSSPDKKRLEPQKFEGRRIQRVEDGWLVLNGEEYRRLMQSINRKAYKAEWERKKRASSGKPLPGQATYERRQREGASEEELENIASNAFKENSPEYRVNGEA